MKVRITMKSPDAVDHAIEEAAKEVLGTVGIHESSDSYADRLRDEMEDIRCKLSTWLKWDEYLTVEFDLEDGTANVIKARR